MNGRSIVLDSFVNAHNHYHLWKRVTTDTGAVPHFHDCYQIVYVIKGRLIHGLPGRQVTLEPGDAFIVPPGYVHGTRADPGHENEYYSLSFHQNLFTPGFVTSPDHQFLSALRLSSMQDKPADVRLRVHLAEPDQKQMERLFVSLLEEFEEKWDMEDTMAGSLITAMLRILARTYFGGQRQDSVKKAKDAVRACIRYIDFNYMLDMNVDDLAHRFALSRSSFAALFTQTAGMPVKQYVNHRRIHQAKNLCSIEDLPLREIATLVGYEDFSTFYRNFKKLTGMSPAEYRDSTKEDQ